MAFFYILSFRSYLYGTDYNGFDIGVFRTHDDAEKTAQRYLHEVPGFCDYDCDYHIHQIELDCPESINHIYSYEGWNEGDDGNVLDLIDGIYPDKDQAESAFAAAKLQHTRQFWTLDRWEIGACEWAEGFHRVLPDGNTLPTLPYLRDTLEYCIEAGQDCRLGFIYSVDQINAQALALGEKLFLVRCGSEQHDDSHSIRLLRDICKIDTGSILYPQLDDPIPDFDLTSLTEDLQRSDPTPLFTAEDFASIQMMDDFSEYPEPPFAPDRIPSTESQIDLTNWRSAFESLMHHKRRITVRQDYDNSPSCDGYITAVENDRVLMEPSVNLLLENPPAEPALVSIEYKNITAIDFSL